MYSLRRKAAGNLMSDSRFILKEIRRLRQGLTCVGIKIGLSSGKISASPKLQISKKKRPNELSVPENSKEKLLQIWESKLSTLSSQVNLEVSSTGYWL